MKPATLFLARREGIHPPPPLFFSFESLDLQYLFGSLLACPPCFSVHAYRRRVDYRWKHPQMRNKSASSICILYEGEG